MFIYAAASFLNLLYRHLVRRLKPRSISGYLNDQGGRCRQLLNHHQRLQQLTRILHRKLPQPLAEHCRVAHVREDTLVLAVDSPVWSSRLRFHVPQLLRALAAEKDARFRDIRLLVVPAAGKTQRRRDARPGLSSAGARLIRETARSVSDPELAAALLRLARHCKSNEK